MNCDKKRKLIIKLIHLLSKLISWIYEKSWENGLFNNDDTVELYFHSDKGYIKIGQSKFFLSDVDIAKKCEMYEDKI